MLKSAVAGFVGVIVGAAVVGMATSQQEELTAKVVRAEKFEVVDTKGRVRIVLETLLDAPCLRLYDEASKIRAALWVSLGGSPSLWLYDEAGKTRATLGACLPNSRECCLYWLLLS